MEREVLKLLDFELFTTDTRLSAWIRTRIPTFSDELLRHEIRWPSSSSSANSTPAVVNVAPSSMSKGIDPAPVTTVGASSAAAVLADITALQLQRENSDSVSTAIHV